MQKLIEDKDDDGNTFWYYWEGNRGHFSFQVQCPEIIVASIIGGPMSVMVECKGKYQSLGAARISDARNKNSILEITIDA